MALDKNQIAKRIAQELQDGFYVNLGIGIPTLVANFIPEGLEIEFQSENGVLGMGPFPFEGDEDADLINAGKYKEAAKEFLKNKEYENAEALNRKGIKKRMEATADAIESLANK